MRTRFPLVRLNGVTVRQRRMLSEGDWASCQAEEEQAGLTTGGTDQEPDLKKHKVWADGLKPLLVLC